MRQEIIKTIKHKNGGFTLVELLVAIFISGLVVGAAGFALSQMLQIESRAGELNEAIIELNRAADYITEDIRSSNKIECHEDSPPSICNTGYNFPPGVKKIMALNVPIEDDSTKKVIYYSRQPESDSIWRGPQALYRREEDDPANVLVDALDFIESGPCGANTPICAVVELKRKDRTGKEKVVTAKAVTRPIANSEEEP